MPLVLKLAGVVAVTTYMLQTGLATPREELVACARRKGELARALLVMLVLGPLAARLLAAAFALPARPAAALVLLSLVGVVPLASRGARNARGNVAFGVVLTAALGIVAAFTTAPAVRLLLGYRGPLRVDTAPLLVQVLLLQGVPIAVGMLLRAKLRRAAALEDALGVFNGLVVLFVLGAAVVLLPRYGAVRSLGWNGALAAVVFAVFIASVGYALVGPDRRDRRALAALANKPNVVLAILVVASAGVDAGFVVAIAGVFLVRFFAGVAFQKLLARSASREAPRLEASQRA
jgi:BASS family bile acid:Na+ symporter